VAVAGSGSAFGFLGMATAPDGDLILAGTYNTGSGLSTTHHIDLVAITPAGGADSSFGTSGIDAISTTTGIPFGSGSRGPLAISAVGQIFFGMEIGEPAEDGDPGTTEFTLSEFNPDGSADTSFGTDGSSSIGDSSTETGPILDILPNGQIVIGAVGGAFVLARFNADGSLDTTFGSDGIETGATVGTGLAMVTASNGETVMLGTASSGSGIVLQEFHTLANSQILYPTYDADYNNTSITNSSGTVVERYSYDPYGNVTVRNPDGTVRGDGAAASSFYESDYLFQGLRYSVSTGTYATESRFILPSLGRFGQEDPAGYLDSPNLYQYLDSDPASQLDPDGEDPGDTGGGKPGGNDPGFGDKSVIDGLEKQLKGMPTGKARSQLIARLNALRQQISNKAHGADKKKPKDKSDTKKTVCNDPSGLEAKAALLALKLAVLAAQQAAADKAALDALKQAAANAEDDASSFLHHLGNEWHHIDDLFPTLPVIGPVPLPRHH
jgi:RHS repeat-associated protein